MAVSKYKYTLQDAQELALSKGGKFLSLEFTTASRKYWWECAQGHQWETAFYVVMKMNCWCRKCYLEKPREPPPPKHSVEDADALAAERNGKMVSAITEVRSDTLLFWQCAESHVWQAKFNNVRRGTWCACCSFEKSERLARRILEFLYDESFCKARPKWLKSPVSTQNLELDCYNEKLAVALEYSGQQHYEICKAFQMTKEDLDSIQARDKAKADQCEARGVRLLIVPYTVKHVDMYKFIRNIAPDLPPNTPSDVPLSTFEVVGQGEEQLRHIQAWLADKFPGAQLRSVGYISSRSPLQFLCAEKHEVQIAWQELCKGSHVCHTCAHTQQIQNDYAKTLVKIDKYLAAHNYKALDHSQCRGANTNMPIECASCSRQYMRTWANVQNCGCCCSPDGEEPTFRQSLLATLAILCQELGWEPIDTTQHYTNDSEFKLTCSTCHEIKETTFRQLEKKRHVCCGHDHVLKTPTVREQTLQKIDRFCKRNGLKVVNTAEYKNNKSKLEWQCVHCQLVINRDWASVGQKFTGCPCQKRR